MNITLRPAVEADTKFARSVHHRAYHEVVVRQFGSWDEALQDKFFQEGWKLSGYEIILLDGVPCGYIRLERLPSEVRGHELVLLPEFQNKGIGTQLLKKMIKECNVKQSVITLQVLKNNRAHELYLRLGFQKVGQTENHILMSKKPD